MITNHWKLAERVFNNSGVNIVKYNFNDDDNYYSCDSYIILMSMVMIITSTISKWMMYNCDEESFDI